MKQSDLDSITTRVRHLLENIAEFQRNSDQLTLNVKVSGNVQQANLDTVQTSINGIRYAQHLLWQALKYPLLKISLPSVTQKERVQQAEPQQVFQVPEPGNVDSTYISPSSKENVHQAEPPQGFQVLGSGKANSVDINSYSKLEETGHQASKPDVSGQPSTSGTRTLYHRCVWKVSTTLGTQRSEPQRCSQMVRNNPHLKRGNELEIKFITVASKDTPNAIKYLSFHFKKLQRPDKKVFTYIKEQETKLELVVNLT
ncbi:hypothetical protein ACS0TY_003940 [Phlomoides rotata]